MALVVIQTGAATKGAEKRMMGWLGDDSYVAVPDNQVGGLGLGDPLEPINAVVEIVRIGIGVRKASLLVDRVHQMGAVAFSAPRHLGVQSNSDDRGAILRV